MSLIEILSSSPKQKKRKRVGRGIASGTGKTCGRGHKGQKSRSGVAIKGFEGGQMPIHRRLPKRGFNNIFREKIEVVNLALIQKAIESGRLKGGGVDKDSLVNAGLIRGGFSVKLLGNGELKEAIEFTVDLVSDSARRKIENVGGKVNV